MLTLSHNRGTYVPLFFIFYLDPDFAGNVFMYTKNIFQMTPSTIYINNQQNHTRSGCWQTPISTPKHVHQTEDQ